MKGLLYLEEGVFVSEDYDVDVRPMRPKAAEPLWDVLKQFGVEHAHEPGIRVVRATVPEDKTSSIFYIEIWGRFKLWCIVVRKNA